MSEALRCANERLLARRGEISPSVRVAPPPSALEIANEELGRRRSAARPQEPAASDRGWLSNLRREVEFVEAEAPKQTVALPLPERLPQPEVRTFVSLNTAALRSADVRVYRVWLLLHHVYCRHYGRQLIKADEAHDLLCGKTSEFRAFTDRYWRIIRADGNSRYWDVLDDGRIFIYGMTDVARSLDVGHLTHGAVLVEHYHLSHSTSRAKQYLYATFHAARDGMPISRDEIAAQTGLSRWVQWKIENDDRALIQSTVNIELVSPPLDVETATWRYGRATFDFTDHLGKQGMPGAQYRARMMPKSYQSQLPASSGRVTRKRVNRLLRRARKGSAGTSTERLYYPSAADAAKANVRGGEAHWRSMKAQNGTQFWRCFFLDHKPTSFWG